MKDLKFDGMTELQDTEVMEVNGGGIREIIGEKLIETFLDYAGDAWKRLANGYADASRNGTFDGMPSPSFRH